MKISIITVTKNNKSGLLRAIESVRSQTYKNVEHIIVDGGSTDGTVEIIKNEKLKIRNEQIGTSSSRAKSRDLKDFSESELPQRDKPYDYAQGDNSLITNHYSLITISEADSGIYDAINKGIKLATGDVIGLLHSDDFFKDAFVLEKYAEAFSQRAKRQAHSDSHYQPPTIDAVYSDLVYVRSKTKLEKREKNNIGKIEHSALNVEHSVIRYWKTQKQEFTTEAQRHRVLENGWMPPHPTLFVRKEIFEKYGLYRADMKIAADYEMILRLFYKHKIIANYLPITTYCMTIGGASNKSLRNIIIKSSEDYRSMKLHKIPFPLYILFCKNFRKIVQFF